MVKHTMELSWKEHSIDLVALESWLKEHAGEHYCGNSADSKLKLHFLEEPSEEIKEAILDKYAELDDEDHEMVKSYKSAEQLKALAASRAEAIKQKKLGMLEKSWANMDAVERKLYLGLDAEVSDEALGL